MLKRLLKAFIEKPPTINHSELREMQERMSRMKRKLVDTDPNLSVEPDTHPLVDSDPNLSVDSDPNLSVEHDPQPSVAPDPNLSIEPDQRPSVDPNSNLSVQPDPRRSVAPNRNLSIQPDQRPSVAPDPNLSVQPDPHPSVKPGQLQPHASHTHEDYPATYERRDLLTRARDAEIGDSWKGYTFRGKTEKERRNGSLFRDWKARVRRIPGFEVDPQY